MFDKSYAEFKKSLNPSRALWVIITLIFLVGCLAMGYFDYRAGRPLPIAIAAVIANFLWAQNPLFYLWRQSSVELSKHWTVFYQYLGLTCLIHITWVELTILEKDGSFESFFYTIVSFVYFVVAFILAALMLAHRGRKETGANQ
jgi:hypothetical protein